MKSVLFILLILELNLFAVTFGVVPQQGSLQLIKVWKPIVEYLKKETGEEITFEIERSIPEFRTKLYKGVYDMAFINSLDYVIINQKYGYLAKARANEDISGILVVKKGSNLSDVAMLKDKIFLFPSRDSFASTLLLKYELLQKYGIQIDENHALYVNSHDSVYKGVYRGIGDVGGGVERTLQGFYDVDAKNELVILYKTKAYPSHPFAFKPSVSQSVQEKITEALLHMPKSLLESLNMHKIVPTENAEYEVVKDLSQKLSVESK